MAILVAMNFIWHFRGQNDFVEHYPLQNPNSVLLKMASFRSQDDNTRGCYSESYLSGCKVILRALMILMLMAIQCFFVSGWWRRSRKPVDLLRGQMYEERRILPELWNFFLHHCKYHLMASDEDKADVNQNPLNDILSPNFRLWISGRVVRKQHGDCEDIQRAFKAGQSCRGFLQQVQILLILVFDRWIL